MAENQSINI